MRQRLADQSACMLAEELQLCGSVSGDRTSARPVRTEPDS